MRDLAHQLSVFVCTCGVTIVRMSKHSSKRQDKVLQDVDWCLPSQQEVTVLEKLLLQSGLILALGKSLQFGVLREILHGKEF